MNKQLMSHTVRVGKKIETETHTHQERGKGFAIVPRLVTMQLHRDWVNFEQITMDTEFQPE